MKKLAEERRQREQAGSDLPPAKPGQQWGTCVGVYEINRDKTTSRGRKVARVLLASGFVVTAYLGVNGVVPAVDAPVLVHVASFGDQPPPDDGIVSGVVSDEPVEHYQLGIEY